MLALCWHIFRSWACFLRSWLPLARLLDVFYSCSSFFSRFGSLRVGFGDVQGHFGGAETAFFGALSCGGVCNSKKLRMHRNHSFACVFVWFLHIASFVFKPQNNANHSRSLSNRASCKDCAPIASWGGFWSGLVLSGASLDRLLFALGRLLASLGHFLGVSWALLGRSWLSLGCSVELHGCISVPRTVPGLDFKGFGASQTEF